MKRPNKLDRAFLRVYREDSRKAQGNKCRYCNEPLTYRTATADHYKAKSTGGNNSKSNIVAACYPCNHAKGSMNPKNFERMIQSFPSGKSYSIIMAWSRRRINLSVERFEKRLNKFMGRKEEQ